MAGALRESLEDAMEPGEQGYMGGVEGSRAFRPSHADWNGLMAGRKPLDSPRDHAFNTSQPTEGAGVDMLKT